MCHGWFFKARLYAYGCTPDVHRAARVCLLSTQSSEPPDIDTVRNAAGQSITQVADAAMAVAHGGRGQVGGLLARWGSLTAD